MRKSQLIILIVAIIAVIFLFNLPRFLINDKKQSNRGKAPNTAVKKGNEPGHNEAKIPEKDLNKLNELRKNYLSVSDKEKKLKFADSLAALFRKVNKFDSSAKYSGEIASLEPSKKNLIKAGDAYFDAYSFALDQEKGMTLEENARYYFAQALEKDTADLDVKTKYAKTLIGTDQTMKGITMLKKVVSVNPNHEEALYELGRGAIQSKQFDKAVDRFEVIVKNNPQNLEAWNLLGYSYIQLGDKKKAIEVYENLKKISNDPEVQATADSYLKELK